MKNHFPPQDKSYTYFQTNRSNNLGSLWSSMNLDFQSNLGTMRGATRLKINTSTGTNSDLVNIPVAFEYFDNNFFTVAGTGGSVGQVFKGGDTPDQPFIVDLNINAQLTYSSTQSDLELFNAQLFASTGDGKIFSLNQASGGTWTSRVTGLGSVFHGMTVLKKFDRLYYIATADKVYSLDTAYTPVTSGDYTLNFATNGQYQIICMRAASNKIWIGTGFLGNPAGRGKIFEWDGISAQPTNEYLLNANGCVSIVIQDDIPYAMDSNGVMLKFSGSSFQEIGRLPSNNLNAFTIYINGSFIHPNGLISTRNNTFLALINNVNTDSGSSFSENFPSGVWEFSTDIGPTHKYSLTYNLVSSSTVTDYGQNRISGVGALFDADIPSTDVGRNGTLMLGATYFTNASSVSSGIFINDSNNTIQKRNYFVTTWFNSQEIEDKWTRLWATYRRFLNSTDKMIFKYRLNEEDPVIATITWVNTTSFTTATDVTAYGPTASGFNGTIGGEVEGIQGTGSGACAHITAITGPSGGLYTVTLDNTVTGVTTGTAKVRFQKWIKLFPEITGQVKSWEQMAIGGNNIRIQIKGTMEWTGDNEFYKFILTSNEDIKATL